MKNFFDNNPALIFIIPLIFFLLLGLVGLYFSITSPEPVPFYGWIVIGGFILIPGLIIYSLTIGFEISDKQAQAIEDRRESLVFDQNGISVVMPLQAATWIIHWDSIETIIYTNFSSDDHAYFEFYLNKIPEYVVHENPWWLAKLFPMKPNRKWVRVSGDARNFSQLPNAVKQYLELNKPVDFSDPRKGSLVSSTVKIQNGKTVTTEHWKPKQHYDSTQLVFDRQKRSLEDLDSSK